LAIKKKKVLLMMYLLKDGV